MVSKKYTLLAGFFCLIASCCLAQVKTGGGRDVEVAFGMVNAVESPEKWNSVIQAMPGVHPAIENENGG